MTRNAPGRAPDTPAADLERLLGLLEREREALLAGDTGALAEVAAEKTAAADRLAGLDPRHPAWPSLAGRARQAQALNRENGLRIGVQATAVAARLAALSGSPGDGGYGPDGRPRHGALTGGAWNKPAG